MEKVLIFGGAFDPPHIEHVNMCKAAMQELGFTKLVIVPTFLPPHKEQGFLTFEDRVDLIKVAFKDINYSIDDIENIRQKDNYSALILPILKEKYGDISYLIGGDSLQYFSTWYKPEEIVKVCPIIVAARDGYENPTGKIELLQKNFGGNFKLISYQGKDVSSSLIRAKLLLGQKPSEISEDTYNLIKEKHLFEDYKDYVDKLKTYQTDELFEHSQAVVLRAIDFNTKHHLNQDFRKVFLATLLHDNAKQRKSVDGLNIPEDAIGTPVLHQFLGAEKAKRDFGIEDEEILNAIKYHTTAKANMTLFEKLIYTADSLSDDRTYDPIPSIRAVAIENFDKGFLAVLQYTYDKVKATGRDIYPLTMDAMRYYLNIQ